MSRRFPLAAVLRVRKIQEDLAGAEVARARLAVEAAQAEVHRRDLRVEDAARRTPTTSAALAGVMASRISLASEAVAARQEVVTAETVVVDRLGEWAQARAARRGVERLAERHADAQRAEADRVAQLALDDRAGADHHRAHQRTEHQQAGPALRQLS